jgi:hypothetical protein
MALVTLLVGGGVALALRGAGGLDAARDVADPTVTPSSTSRATPEASEDDSAAPSRAVPLEAGSLAVLDPSDDGENDADLALMVDGDEATAWVTEGYNAPEFGNLKPGVGFTIDLGSVRDVQQVSFEGAVDGVAVELRASSSRISDAEDAEVVAVSDELPATGSFDLDGPVEARYLLVWITGALQPDGNGFNRAGFGEIDVVAS